MNSKKTLIALMAFGTLLLAGCNQAPTNETEENTNDAAMMEETNNEAAMAEETSNEAEAMEEGENTDEEGDAMIKADAEVEVK